ncbi:hypothetical protein [Parasphingorhabdus sp.]|uniref:hypothetical protein n=1 Tax=Parasphingorhabdus sp. TaxID=2709688 RepID=UPI003BB0BBC1
MVLVFGIFAFSIYALKAEGVWSVRNQPGKVLEGHISKIFNKTSEYSIPTTAYMRIELKDGRKVLIKDRVNFIVTCRVDDKVQLREMIADNGRYFYKIEPKKCVDSSKT